MGVVGRVLLAKLLYSLEYQLVIMMMNFSLIYFVTLSLHLCTWRLGPSLALIELGGVSDLTWDLAWPLMSLANNFFQFKNCSGQPKISVSPTNSGLNLSKKSSIGDDEHLLRSFINSSEWDLCDSNKMKGPLSLTSSGKQKKNDYVGTAGCSSDCRTWRNTLFCFPGFSTRDIGNSCWFTRTSCISESTRSTYSSKSLKVGSPSRDGRPQPGILSKLVRFNGQSKED